MEISVIGGGSIGLLIAALFTMEDKDVTLYTRTKEQSMLVNRNGISLTFPNKEKIKLPCKADVIDGYTNEYDITFVTVKSYNISDVLPYIEKSKHIVFLQNGISHLDVMEKMITNNVSVGIVEHGATREGDTSVAWRGIGRIRYSVIKGSISNELKIVLQQNKFLQIEFEESYEESVYEKLVINACINPLTAVLQVKNGELLTNQYYYEVFCAAFKEINDALQIREDKKMMLFDKVCNVCRLTSENDSSMKLDVQNKRKTEIDSILLPIIKKSKGEKKECPVLEQLYNMVKGKE